MHREQMRCRKPASIWGDRGWAYREVKAMMLAHVYLLIECYEALSEDVYENTKEEIRFQIDECIGSGYLIEKYEIEEDANDC